jgi:predicted dehydrogenase
MMNIYGKQASAFYNWFDGLRYFERGKDQPVVVPCEENDEIAEELVEFADCIRGDRVPEMGGEGAIKSLAVIRAGVLSVEEGRRVEVVEVL